MKLLAALVSCIVGLSLFSGCTLTRGSSIVVGAKRKPIDSSMVKIYMRPPAKFEEVGLVTADGRNAFASDQNLMDNAIQRLKKEAGKLGANGVILSGAGDQYVGSVGSSFGTANAYQNGNGVTAYGTGVSASSAVFAKKVSGMAIFVIHE